jgi:lipoteichoic acid synthase
MIGILAMGFGLFRQLWHKASPRALIAGVALILALCLIVARGVILWGDLRTLSAGDAVVLLLHGCFQDMAFLLALTMAFLAWSLLRGHAEGMRAHVAVFVLVALLVLVQGAGNITAVRMLGEPLTLAWVQYSDLLYSRETMNSVNHLIGPRLIGLAVAGVILFFVLSGIVAALLHRRPAVLSALPYLCCLGLLVLFVASQSARPVNPGKLSNPAVAFAQSLYATGLSTAHLEAPTTDTVRDLVGTVPASTRPDVPAGQVRNVIFYAMESTPAKYTEGFGGNYPVMPNLRKYLPMSRAFTNAYAHAPASNYFLVAAIAGIVPELSADSMTYSLADTPFISIGHVLRDQGYRTGFFNSADNDFQNTTPFMTAAGFDTVLDYRDWPCDRPIYETDFESGSDVRTANDLCTIPPLLDWIDADPSRPFVAMLRTGLSHYPYFAGDNPQTYTANADFNRYLNAVRVGDQAFGLMMAGLAEKGLLDSTLVVVVGDHGEAFGEHGTISHASAIYEENIHVPLMLINPVLFAGDQSDVLAGVSDLSPTVLDLLGFATPATWQGRSLFAEGRTDAVLLFAPWNGFQVGFRQGQRKFIHNAQSGENWLFDLATDPGEQRNLALTDPAASASAQRILAALIDDQIAQTARLRQGTPPPTAAASTTAGLVLYATGTMFETPPQAQIMIDGQTVGQISVTGAPSNADIAVADGDVDGAVAAYSLPLDLQPCAKRIEVTFLNDEWAGENLTGDTDLYVQRLDLDGKSYWPKQFELATDRAGGLKRDYFSLWRTGSFWVDLDLPATCLSDSLTAP